MFELLHHHLNPLLVPALRSTTAFFDYLLKQTEAVDRHTHLETAHPGGGLDQDDPGQQEQERAGNQAVDGLPVQEQAGVNRFSQAWRLVCRRQR